MLTRSPNRTLILALTVFVVFMLIPSSGAAGFVLERNPSPADASSNNVTEVNDVLVNEQTLTYDGGNVTGATVIVNNTGSELTLEVRVSLRTLDGVVVTEGTDSQVVTQGTLTFTISLDAVRSEEYAYFEVHVRPVDVSL